MTETDHWLELEKLYKNICFEATAVILNNRIIWPEIPDAKKLSSKFEVKINDLIKEKNGNLRKNQKIFIDIILDIPDNSNRNQAKRQLLERWFIDSTQFNEKKLSKDEAIAAIRKARVFMRCLQAYSLVLPCYQLFRQLKRNRQTVVSLKYSIYSEANNKDEHNLFKKVGHEDEEEEEEEEVEEKGKKEEKEKKNSLLFEQKKRLIFERTSAEHYEFSPISQIKIGVAHVTHFNLDMSIFEKKEKPEIVEDYFHVDDTEQQIQQQIQQTKSGIILPTPPQKQAEQQESTTTQPIKIPKQKEETNSRIQESNKQAAGAITQPMSIPTRKRSTSISSNGEGNEAHSGEEIISQLSSSHKLRRDFSLAFSPLKDQTLDQSPSSKLLGNQDKKPISKMEDKKNEEESAKPIQDRTNEAEHSFTENKFSEVFLYNQTKNSQEKGNTRKQTQDLQGKSNVKDDSSSKGIEKEEDGEWSMDFDDADLDANVHFDDAEDENGRIHPPNDFVGAIVAAQPVVHRLETQPMSQTISYLLEEFNDISNKKKEMDEFFMK